jgi:hypothetical protein
VRRSATAVLTVVLAVSVLSLGAPVARAACAPDPDALTFREMVIEERTGVEGYPVMFLGVDVANKDLGGGRGGKTIARFAVAEHPAGRAPLVSRVRFWRDPPGTVTTDHIEFHVRTHYVVIASRRADGTFDSDGGCGQTRKVSRSRFRALVHLARE